MRGLVRLLVMFGPMIFRQFEKYQRNKERQQRSNPSYGTGRTPEMEPRYSRSKRSETPPPPPPPRKKELSEEEKNFSLKEEEFMIDADVLDDYETDKNIAADLEPTTKDTVIDEAQAKTDEVSETNTTEEASEENNEEDDLDLKDLFFDKDAD